MNVTTCLCLLVLMASANAQFIRLKSTTIDTNKEKHIKDDSARFNAEGSQRSSYIITLKTPITGDMKAAVSDFLQCSLNHYLPDNSFLVFTTAQQLKKALSLPHIQWAGFFKSEYKQSPELKETAARFPTQAAQQPPPAGTVGLPSSSSTSNTVMVTIVLAQNNPPRSFREARDLASRLFTAMRSASVNANKQMDGTLTAISADRLQLVTQGIYLQDSANYLSEQRDVVWLEMHHPNRLFGGNHNE